MTTQPDQPTQRQQALDWLMAHPEEAKTITGAVLAGQLGWKRPVPSTYDAIHEYRGTVKKELEKPAVVQARIEKWLAAHPGQTYTAPELAGFVSASPKTTERLLRTMFGHSMGKKRTAPGPGEHTLPGYAPLPWQPGGHPASAEEALGELGNAETRRVMRDLRAKIRELEDEIRRLKTEGTPGVMHSADRAFYDLVIKERNYYRMLADGRFNDDGSPRRPE